MPNPNEPFESFDYDCIYDFTYELSEQQIADISKEMGQLASDEITKNIIKEREEEVAQHLERAKHKTNVSYLTLIALLIFYLQREDGNEK